MHAPSVVERFSTKSTDVGVGNVGVPHCPVLAICQGLPICHNAPLPELPPELDPEPLPELDPEPPPELDPELPPELDPELPPELDPELPPELDPEPPPELDPE